MHDLCPLTFCIQRNKDNITLLYYVAFIGIRMKQYEVSYGFMLRSVDPEVGPPDVRVRLGSASMIIVGDPFKGPHAKADETTSVTTYRCCLVCGLMRPGMPLAACRP